MIYRLQFTSYSSADELNGTYTRAEANDSAILYTNGEFSLRYASSEKEDQAKYYHSNSHGYRLCEIYDFTKKTVVAENLFHVDDFSPWLNGADPDWKLVGSGNGGFTGNDRTTRNY